MPSCKRDDVQFAPSRIKKYDYICNRCLTDGAVKRKQPSRNWNGRHKKPTYKAKQRVKARRWHLKKHYGITEEKFQEMLKSQNGKCLFCPNPATDVDHCHKTMVVRGILCNSCNRGLGAFKDNTEAMRKAIAYLEVHSARG